MCIFAALLLIFSVIMRNIHNHQPSLISSLIPLLALIAGISILIITRGADAVQELSHGILLSAAAIAGFIAIVVYRRPLKALRLGIAKSASQILPMLPILLLIGTVSATWMLSGVVPTLISYGVSVLNPQAFLVTVCAVSAIVSVLSGSSWTTIATIGVAFMGIGTVWGYSPAWIAGAVISGAYFGDKVSPLSDTTVLASSTCGVSLFTHIRYLMLTSIPAMVVALVVFGIKGFTADITDGVSSMEMVHRLHETFNITPWCLLIPALTLLMIVMRINTMITLAVSTLLGVAGIYLWQPEIITLISGSADMSLWQHIQVVVSVLATETSIATGSQLLDSLLSTGGMEGMLPTVALVLSAMVFGGVMMGSGMFSTITRSVTRRLSDPRHSVLATVGSGIMLNSCTGDQYLSIILNGNLYRNLYHRSGLEPRLLSRTVEDSTSVTSVLIPWNSCGLTQSAVLGVSTIHYLPYCIFNIASPLMSIAFVWLGIKVKVLRRSHAA